MANEAWPEVTIGDVAHVKHGFAFRGEFFSDDGDYIVVTPGNFNDEGGFKPKVPEKFYVGPVDKDYVLESGDVLVVMTEQTRGLLGSAGVIPASGKYLHNQRLGRLTNLHPDVDRTFLYYLFNYGHTRDQIQATANGAKVRHTSPSRINEVRFRLPPLYAQRKAVAVLFAYDELIENNLRRIEILEEMAQSIYREWFVNFRFPGYEKVELTETTFGLAPAGWRVSTFGEIANETREGVDPGELTPDAMYVGLEHIPRRSIVLTEKGAASEVSSRKWKFETGDILFGKLRPYFHKVVRATCNGICSTDVITIRPTADHQEFALFVAASEPFVAHATSTAGGTDRPRATWKDLEAYPLALPPQQLLIRFRESVRPVIELMTNLVQQTRNLRDTRDLLLPKLISGEIDISELDIDTSWLAA